MKENVNHGAELRLQRGGNKVILLAYDLRTNMLRATFRPLTRLLELGDCRAQEIEAKADLPYVRQAAGDTQEGNSIVAA